MNDEFHVEDNERSRRMKLYEDAELRAFLKEHPWQNGRRTCFYIRRDSINIFTPFKIADPQVCTCEMLARHFFAS